MTASPFAAVLSPDSFPACSGSSSSKGRAVLEGTMDLVWHRPPWIRPLLSMLGRHGLLFPDTGRAVPARLVIGGAGGVHDWRRTFAFPRVRRLEARLLYDARRRCVVERLGRIGLDWRLDFRPPSTLEIATTGLSLTFGRVRLPLPRRVCPTVTAIEVATGTSRLWVSVTAWLPILGPFFGYSGTFELRPC
jgi:Domain of unknown function (DUF4166)